MTEQDRKFLTGWLGEKWHNGTWSTNPDSKFYNRTFTTPTDVQALVDRLKEKGIDDLFVINHSLLDWFYLEPEQQCQLFAYFLKSLEVVND